jgi:predicted  nucleic acid-binding Zn-ribbon protein
MNIDPVTGATTALRGLKTVVDIAKSIRELLRHDKVDKDAIRKNLKDLEQRASAAWATIAELNEEVRGLRRQLDRRAEL